MRPHLPLAGLIVSLLLRPGVTLAAPVSVTLTLSQASDLSLLVNALSGITASTLTTLSGTQTITIDNGNMRNTSTSLIDLADTIKFNGGNLNMGDASLALALGPLGNVLAGFKNAHLNGLTSTRGLPLSYVGGNATFNFDPADPFGGNVTSTSINNGVLTYNGSGAIALLLGSGTLDFAANPLGFDLPSLGNVALLNQSETLVGIGYLNNCLASTYNVDVILSAPISLSDNILTDPIDVMAVLRGQIVATGSYLYTVSVLSFCPEPSSVVLLSLAGIGALPLVRRIRRPRR